MLLVFPALQAQQDIEQRARQSAAAEDSHAASVRAAKQAQRERGAAALQRSRSEAVPSARVPSPSRKDRRNWSPGKRDVRAPLALITAFATPIPALLKASVDLWKMVKNVRSD